MRTFLLIFLCLSFMQAKAQQQPATAIKSLQVSESDLQWMDTKPPLLPGAKVAVLEGNQKESGHFTIRLKFPPYYKIPPHIHPVDERTTVLKGTISIGFGDMLDTTQ